MLAPLFSRRAAPREGKSRVGRVFVELGAVRLFEPADVAGELDRRHLHPETEPEIGNLVFARETRRADFSFDATLAESARESARRPHP